jgi:uracil-DNA glycosylase
MTCSGAFATAADYQNLLCAGIDLTDADEVAIINSALALAASDVHVALAAAGACECTYASWALTYLKKLNVIDAAVLQNCPCGTRLTDERKQTLIEWLDRQFELIRTGKVTVCAGDTGADFPAFATAEFSWTEWNEAEIIVNNELRRV